MTPKCSICGVREGQPHKHAIHAAFESARDRETASDPTDSIADAVRRQARTEGAAKAFQKRLGR